MSLRCEVWAVVLLWQMAVVCLTVGADEGQRQAAPQAGEPEPVVPTEVVKLFNGRDLTGLYTWMTDTKLEDPRGVFSVTAEGQLRISGDGYGYISTRGAYRDYRLVVEYRWGKATWRGREKAAKDSGILLHARGPDGNSGAWMASIECQIIEGGTGDFIIVNARDKSLPVSLTCEVETRGRATVWSRGGQRQTFTSGRIDWFGRDPNWRDVLGFRGAADVESPDVPGEAGWTRVECVCRGDRITTIVNGQVVNEGYEARPSSGKILLQTEGAELFVRKWELHPLTAQDTPDHKPTGAR